MTLWWKLGCFMHGSWTIGLPSLRTDGSKKSDLPDQPDPELPEGGKNPDKPFIGRASKRFDFLGYHLSPRGLSVAAGTIDHHIERIDRLYEQGASPCHIGQYIRRWWAWVATYLVFSRTAPTGLAHFHLTPSVGVQRPKDSASRL